MILQDSDYRFLQDSYSTNHTRFSLTSYIKNHIKSYGKILIRLLKVIQHDLTKSDCQTDLIRSYTILHKIISPGQECVLIRFVVNPPKLKRKKEILTTSSLVTLDSHLRCRVLLSNRHMNEKIEMNRVYTSFF